MKRTIRKAGRRADDEFRRALRYFANDENLANPVTEFAGTLDADPSAQSEQAAWINKNLGKA